MAKAKRQQPKTAAEEKRRPGRPRSSPFDPLEQARLRRQRHRERKRKAGMVAAEIWLPEKWHDAVIARGETLPGRSAGRGSSSNRVKIYSKPPPKRPLGVIFRPKTAKRRKPDGRPPNFGERGH